MALTGSFESADGTVHTNAYAKVVSLNLDYMMERASITVNVFKDSTARTSGKAPVSCDIYQVEPTAGELSSFSGMYGATAQDAENNNPVKATYVALKNLDRFSTWVDA